MFQFPIGIMLDSLRMETGAAIEKAAEMGVQGFQMYATSGKYSPEELTAEKRRELLRTVKAAGLRFSALCGDFGCGFGDRARNPELIERSRRILDLAMDLETNVVTTHIGVVPEDPSHERYQIMQEACGELSDYADRMRAHFAIETGPEPALTLRRFLDSLGSRGVAVNLDPANLVMVTGDDPVQAVYTLRDYIVHTHAKDGVRLQAGNPEYIYGVVHPVPQELAGVRYFEELPLGKGGVDFPAYLRALDEIGYRGFLTIEREVGDDPVRDITAACGFLREQIRAGL